MLYTAFVSLPISLRERGSPFDMLSVHVTQEWEQQHTLRNKTALLASTALLATALGVILSVPQHCCLTDLTTLPGADQGIFPCLTADGCEKHLQTILKM